jgi:hypothetical protein
MGLFLGLLFVLSQKVLDGLFKQFVRSTLLVNRKNLELFKQLTINRCRESFSFGHDFLYIPKKSHASKKSFDVVCICIYRYISKVILSKPYAMTTRPTNRALEDTRNREVMGGCVWPGDVFGRFCFRP